MLGKTSKKDKSQVKRGFLKKCQNNEIWYKHALSRIVYHY